MKRVEAVIRSSHVDAVRTALARRGVAGLTVTDVTGCGREPARVDSYRGVTFARAFVARARVEVVTDDADARPTACAIADAADTGHVGDGLVYITPVDDAVRIRTGEHGLAAIREMPAETFVPRRAVVG